MKAEKPIPDISSEEDEQLSPKPENKTDLGRRKQWHSFWLNILRILEEAVIKYAGLGLVAGLFLLFYWVLKKEDFANEGHITQLFELIQTATLLVLGYMFGERRCK